MIRFDAQLIFCRSFVIFLVHGLGEPFVIWLPCNDRLKGPFMMATGLGLVGVAQGCLYFAIFSLLQ